MPKLETIFPICVKGCRIIRDAEFLEDIRYFDKSLAEHRNPDIVGKKNEVTLYISTFLLRTHLSLCSPPPYTYTFIPLLSLSPLLADTEEMEGGTETSIYRSSEVLRRRKGEISSSKVVGFTWHWETWFFVNNV